MLETAVPRGKLLAGYLIFHKNIEEKLQKYVVEKDHLLTNKDSLVKVRELEERNVVLTVDVSQLLVHKGLILCVPKELYSVTTTSLLLHDSIHEEVLEEILYASLCCIEDELLFLPDISVPELIDLGIAHDIPAAPDLVTNISEEEKDDCPVQRRAQQ